MAAPASLLKQLNSPASPRATWSPRPASADIECIARYQLHVVAPKMADAVASVGGLIFDRAMAGWDVTVLVDGDPDDRPVRILGGRVACTMSRLLRAEAPRPQAMAVATDLLVKSEQIRRLVLAARNAKASEVLLWGRHHPPNLNCRLMAVHHQPSAAAHAFKSHALDAGGAVGSSLTEESFYSVT